MDTKKLTCLRQKLDIIFLGFAPIYSISNYEFPNSEYLSILRSDIAMIKNVVFNQRDVVLDGNPLRSMTNVIFTNVQQVHMNNCGITMDVFEKFDMYFTGKLQCELYLRGNNITVGQLKQRRYRLPGTLTRIILDDGAYTTNKTNHLSDKWAWSGHGSPSAAAKTKTTPKKSVRFNESPVVSPL